MSKNINEHSGHRKRVFQNFLRAGSLNGFSDVQILEMILFYVIPIRNTNPTAHNLIKIFGTAEEVFNASPLEIINKTNYSPKTACVLSIMSKFYEIISIKDTTIALYKNSNIPAAPSVLLEKFVYENSFDNFDDLEILELFLYFSESKSSKDNIMHNLLDEFILMTEIFRAKPNEMLDKIHCSLKTACFLSTPSEICKRFAIKNINDNVLRCNSVEKIVEYLIPYLANKTEEYFYMICVDKNMLEQRTLCLSKGDKNSAEVKMNELMKSVLSNNASRIFIAHNHPSGDVTPSAEDLNLTSVISIALKSVDVKLMDHIIIGKNSYFSFAQNNLYT